MTDTYKVIYQQLEETLEIMLKDIDKDAKESMRRKRYTQTDEAFNNGAKVAINSIKSKLRAIKREQLKKDWDEYRQRKE